MAATTAAKPSSLFSLLSDDLVLNIFHKLESEPREWASLACVSSRFSLLIRDICCKAKCTRSISAVVSDLISASDCQGQPPGGWAAIHKLSVCCPGLLCAGVLLENSDFGLEREIGPDESYHNGAVTLQSSSSSSSSSSSVESAAVGSNTAASGTPPPCNSAAASADCKWSLFDDLYFDTVYDASESHSAAMEVDPSGAAVATGVAGWEFSKKRKKQCCARVGCHLATGGWNPSREQGNKLLASRFRGDCLYICDWPGCVHAEEKRKYMLFRGVFKNFKRSRVWRAIADGNRNKIELDCAFCRCRETWDLHSAFCLRRVFGFHDDGEPVVRAYVCENGHVSGAWTERPLYA